MRFFNLLRTERGKKLSAGALLFAAIFSRYAAYGFRYYPQLDDYIQYDKYTLQSISEVGLLGARPLSNVMDILFWGKMWGFLILAVAIISPMFAASALLFRETFSKYFKTGYFFYAVYALLPFAFEGVYWLSASTRIVCALFYTALALYAFVRFLEGGKKRYLALYIPAQLAAFASYEQGIVLSFALTFIFAALSLKTSGKRWLTSLFSVSNAAIYFVFTGYFSKSGLYASSGYHDLILPTEAGYFSSHLPAVIKQIFCALGKSNVLTLTKGFARGAEMILNDRLWLYAAVLVILAVLFFLVLRRTNQRSSSDARFGVAIALIFAVVAAILPLAPFFVQRNLWVCLRGAVMCMTGIALLADIVLSLIFKNKNVAAAVFACLVVWFGVASVSELHDYKVTFEHDSMIAEAMVRDIPNDENVGLKIGLLNVESCYLEDQNYYYHEHIHGVTESSWAIGGIYYSYADAENNPKFTPLHFNTPLYENWNKEANAPESFDKLYLYDKDENRFTQVWATLESSSLYLCRDESGTVLATIELVGNEAYGSLVEK